MGGQDIQYQPGLKTKTAGLDHNLAGLLAFITPAGLIWIFAEEKTPQNRWLRFMSFQALFGWVAISILYTVISIIGSILGSIVGVLATIFSLIGGLFYLGGLVFMVLTALKAHKGETPRLPVVSKFAAKYA